MPLYSCSRCGTETPSDGLLCPGCTDWLSQQTELDEAAVVDATQFAPKPVPGESPVQIGFVAPALPLFLEVLFAIIIVIAIFGDSFFYELRSPGARMFIYLYLASVFLTFGNLALGAYDARLHPLRAAIISTSVSVALMVLTVMIFRTAAMEKFFGDLVGILYMRIVAVGLFAVPLGIAILRQRKLSAARTKLLALKASAADPPADDKVRACAPT